MGKVIAFPINNSSSVGSSILLEDKELDWSEATYDEMYEAYKEFYSKESNYINL
ncbi:TPA: hypothetical protein ACF2DR_001721 [Clostridium perfringens]